MIQRKFAGNLLECFECISIFKDVLDDAPCRIARDLISHVAEPGSGSKVRKLAADLFYELAARIQNPAAPPAGSLWQNYLLDRIIMADNAFTRLSASAPGRGEYAAGLITTAAAYDLRMLRSILDIDYSGISPSSSGDCLHLGLISQPFPGLGRNTAGNTHGDQILALKKNLLASRDWAGALELLSDFHRRSGCGVFAGYYALRWDGLNKKLTGIADPDPVRLENLYGYDQERGQVVQNTERLVSGLPAGNVLLYGDRGTGKSSTVKALLNRFGPRGLRIIELPKPFLGDYQLILAALRDIGLKFIIFVDDLSFEDHEGEYRALKSMLDGSFQISPENVIIYATSNRRHLVREYFDERRQEVGRSDTVQEKLSLSDRFGITVLFLSPDQDLYLKIVDHIAHEKGIGIPDPDLRLLALEWERWHNSRSGRTARQFVDQLTGHV